MPEWKKLCWGDLTGSSFVLNQNSLRVTIPVNDGCDCSDVRAHLSTVLWATSIGFWDFISDGSCLDEAHSVAQLELCLSPSTSKIVKKFMSESVEKSFGNQ